MPETHNVKHSDLKDKSQLFPSYNRAGEDADARLIANGYEPIAVGGKAPHGDAWQSRPNTVEAIRAERAAHPNATNIGLRTGRLGGLDIDLHDPAHAATIASLVEIELGIWDAMKRVGSKGAMLCFRNETPISKITISGMAPGAKPGDKAERVEILGAGQQFVAYGIHPDTGKPYRWPDTDISGEPLTVPLDELPEVTPENLRTLAAACAETLTELGYTGVRVSDRGDQKRAARVHAERTERDPVRAGELIDRLRFLDPGVDRLAWIKYVAAIRSTNLMGIEAPEDMDDDLLEIACAWSRGEYWKDGETPKNYRGDNDVEDNFYSLDPNLDSGAHFGSIDHDAREAGFMGRPAGEQKSGEAFQKALDNLRQSPSGENNHSKTTGVRLICAADVEPEKITWLWPGHYACGKVHLRAGTPEAGKNVSAIDTAAILSRGGSWPDGDTLIWSGEDSFRDTTLPRFLAAGGNRSRFHTIRDVAAEDGTKRPFDPAVDVPDLCESIKGLPNLRYIIIDPISVVVGTGHGASHNDAETRRALAPLVELAEARGIVVEGIIHFAKGTSGRSILERVMGSTAFSAVARVVHAVAKFGDDEPRRFVRAKCNIAKAGGAIGYEFNLKSAPVPGYPDFDDQPQVVWGAPLKGSPEELLAGEGKSNAKDEAAKFLRAFLIEAGAKGVPTGDLEKAAKSNGHSWATIQRARAGVPITVFQYVGVGHNGWGWRWSGPEMLTEPGGELPF